MRPVTCRKGAVSMVRLFGSWLYLMFPEIMVLGSVLERFIQCAEKDPCTYRLLIAMYRSIQAVASN